MSRVIFAHANVLDGEHPAKPDSSVAVQGNRIQAVGAVEPEPGDRVIDCAGRTVMPGMVQGHYHSTFRDLAPPLMPPVGLEHPPAYQAYVAADNVRLALNSGFTSVVGAAAPWDIDASLASAIDAGIVRGPRVVPGSRELTTTADSGDAVPWWWDATATGSVRLCNGPDEFTRAVRTEIKRGAEIIKVSVTGGHGVRLPRDVSSITRAELHAAVEAAHGLGKRVRAHVASKPGILACIEAGVDIIDHGDGLDEECIAAFAELGVIWLPTAHSFMRRLDAFGESHPETNSEFGRAVRGVMAMIPAAVEAGVTICLGDDYGSTVLPHGVYGEELGRYVKWTGVPPSEVLRWATVNGGALVGRSDVGRLEEGAVADLLVVDGDPCADIDLLGDVENIRVVMRDGEFLVDD